MSVFPHISSELSILPPSNITQMRFGNVFDTGTVTEQPLTNPMMHYPSPSGYVRTWTAWTSVLEKDDIGSTVKIDLDTYEATLDVRQFEINEVYVRVVHTDCSVVVVGQYSKEREDKFGQVYRHFVRKYILPKNCDLPNIEICMSEGILKIICKRLRQIPIENPNDETRESSKKDKKGKDKGKKGSKK